MKSKNKNIFLKTAIIALSLGFAPILALAQMQEGTIKLLPPHLTVNFELNSNLPDDATEYYNKITDAIISAIPRRVDLLHDTADFAKTEPVYERISVIVKLPDNAGGSIIRNFNIDIAIPQEKLSDDALEIKYVNRSDVVRKGDIVVHTGRYEDFIRKIEAIRQGKIKEISPQVSEGKVNNQTKGGDWFANELARIVREGKVANGSSARVKSGGGYVGLSNSDWMKVGTTAKYATGKTKAKPKVLHKLPVGKFINKVKVSFFGDSDEIIASSAAALEQFLSGMLSAEGKKAKRLRFVLVTNLGLENDLNLAERRFDNVEAFAASRGLDFSQYIISFISVSSISDQYLVIEAAK